MKFRSVFSRLLLLSMVIFLLPGCQHGMQVEYVEGKVTFQNNPVEGASVVFSPAPSSPAALSAFGKTDSNGVYKLTAQQNITHGGGKGTAEGEYIVTISKMVGGYDENLVGKSPEEVSKLDRMRNEGKYSPKMVPYENKLPGKYKDPNTSKLTATVKKGKNLNVDFALTD